MTPRRLTYASFAALLIAVAGCGGSDGANGNPFESNGSDPDTVDSEIDDPEEIEATGTQVLVSAYGTTAGGAVDGFERWDGGCDIASSYDGPSLPTGDISVPATWMAIGSGDGVRLAIEDIEKNLSTGVSQQDREIGAEAVLDTLFGTIEYEIVGTVDVGSASVPVGFGNGAYRMASLVGEVRGNANVDFYHELNFGLSGSGDISVVPRDDVLAVFASFTVDPCVVDDRTAGFIEREFEIVD
ncbi:MAG: hypothetical protein AB8G14_02890 [Ilumatobacter sp.]